MAITERPIARFMKPVLCDSTGAVISQAGTLTIRLTVTTGTRNNNLKSGQDPPPPLNMLAAEVMGKRELT